MPSVSMYTSGASCARTPGERVRIFYSSKIEKKKKNVERRELRRRKRTKRSGDGAVLRGAGAGECRAVAKTDRRPFSVYGAVVTRARTSGKKRAARGESNAKMYNIGHNAKPYMKRVWTLNHAAWAALAEVDGLHPVSVACAVRVRCGAKRCGAVRSVA